MKGAENIFLTHGWWSSYECAGVSGHMACGSAWHGSQQCLTNKFELEIKLKAKRE